MKKNVKSLFLISGIACLIFASCKGVTDSGSGQYGGGSGDTEINIPESYGQSELPDLSQASAFSGKAYLRYDNEKVSRDEDEAFFFNNDGTCFIKEAEGIAGGSGGNMSYSFRQLSNISYGSYSYNPSTQKLVLKLKAFCYGNKMFSDAQSVVDVKLKLLRQDALASGYTSVSLPQEWIDAQKNIYARQLSGLQVEYGCSIEDGKLVFDFSGQDDGDYKYYENSVRFKLYLNDFDIRIENGSYSLENPVIYTMENGRFTGADFKWTFAEKAAVLTKVGDFEGTYELEYGTCYAKLTSVTGDIPYAIKNMVGTEYELKPDKSDSTKRVYKPILKTINYTVIGSDDEVASEQAQFYISNPDMTEWTDGTFKYLSAQYITGIFSNQECTRSVMGKEILDGAGVYVKLKDITAVQYNAQVENFTETSGDGVALTVQKQCKVKFDLNDGSGNTYEQEFTSGIPFEVSYYNFGNILSRDYSENVYFAGWATERNSTEAMYGKSGNYYETYTLTEDTVLYAVWKKIYSVIIKDPDGVCSDEVCKNTNGEYPVDYVYVGVSKPFFKDGYIVVGYAKDKNASEPDYTYGSDIPLSDFGDSTKLVLYVVWKENRFLVSFETYGGTGIDSVKTDCIVKSPVSTKNNYEFENWYTSSNFTGEPVRFPFYVTEPVTLYAKWKQIAFPVSFETNGGSFINAITTELITELPITSRENYDFAGWFISSDLSGEPVTFPYLVTDSIVLYAKWIQNYLVEFETFGGTSISSFRARNIESVENPEKDGFTFIEWYLDSSFMDKAVFPIALTADIKFYAKYKQNFTVEFETFGGTEIESVYNYIIYEPEIPSKEYKSFAGWYSDESLSAEFEVNFPYEPQTSVTLYAKWDPIILTISYDANGATDGSVPEITFVEKGNSFTLSSNIGELKKFGYIFSGWSTSQNGEEKINVGQSIVPLTNTVFYAVWDVDYTTMVDVEGGSFYFSEGDAKIILDSFKMAQYEVTYELYLEVYNWAIKNGYTMNFLSKGITETDTYKSNIPACRFTWDGACVWLNAYSEYNNYEPVYYRGDSIWKDENSTTADFSWNQNKNGFRLPTECEWEYAAKGGKNQKTYVYAGSNERSEVANFGSELLTVGKKAPNSLGIYDMSGNAAEWCYDYYGSFGSGELTNPIHHNCYASSYYYRIVRGPSYAVHMSSFMTLASRGFFDSSVSSELISVGSSPTYINYNCNAYHDTIGIRPVRNVK